VHNSIMNQVSLRDYCEEARSLIQSGETDRAIQIVRHILRRYPRHLESYLLLGQALLVAGHYDEAATQFRRVLSADPEDATARVGLAKIYEARGDPEKALRQIQRASELLPGDSDLRAHLVRLLSAYEGGDLSAEQPELTPAALGRIYARQGLYAKAIEEFRSVLTQDPDRTDVQSTLAEVLWRAGQSTEAVKVCHELLQRLPHALKANLIVGGTWADSGQTEAAEPHLSLAQSLDPENELAQALFEDKSPVEFHTVMIEPLQEEKKEWTEPQLPSIVPVESMPAVIGQEPVVEETGKLYEEEATLMSEEERPDEEFQLPDWLKGVGDDLLETEEQPAAASSSEQDAEAVEETPDWLKRLLARSEEAEITAEPPPGEPAETPAWLQELGPEEAMPLSGLAGADQPWHAPESPLTAWEPEEEPVSQEAAEAPMPEEEPGKALWEQIPTEEGVDLASAEEALPPETAGMSAEEWLRSTDELEQPLRPPAAEEPSPAEAEAPPPPTTEPELPDWLKEFQVPEAEVEERAFLEPIRDESVEPGVPDWLQQIMTGPSAPEEEAEPVAARAEAPVDETELPEWLRQMQAPEPEERAVEPEPGPQPTVSAEEGKALWEQILAEEGVDLASAEEAPPPEAAGMSAEEWLRSTADLERPLRPPAAPPPAAEEPSLAEPEMPAGEAEEQEFAPIAGDELEMEGLPDWLRGIATGEPVPAEEEAAAPPEAAVDQPDWLRELQEPTPEAEPQMEAAPEPGAQIEQRPEEGVEVEIDQAGLPDWMRELQEGAPEPEPSVEVEAPPEVSLETPLETEKTAEVEIDETGVSDWLRGPSVEEPEPEAPGVPDWLAELETGDILLQETDVGEPIELQTGDMPEWLGEIMAGEPPLAGEWAARAEETEAGQEQVPDWLIEFRRREETETVAESPAEVVEPEVSPEIEQLEAEELYEAELPDWLAQLREGVPEAEIPEELAPELEALITEEIPLEPEPLEIEEAGPAWLGDLVRAEEETVELELLEEEEVFPVEVAAPELVEPVEAEAPVEELLPVAELELEEEELPLPEVEWEEELPGAEVPELTEVPSAVALGTRELEVLSVEELPGEASARLSMARAALNAGDWSEALTIYETLVNASELLDSVIDHLRVGLQRYPDEVAGYELLGDACMKDGRLYEALQAYRSALSKL
jgi:tetratricopeptide (TPR) repeat protein